MKKAIIYSILITICSSCFLKDHKKSNRYDLLLGQGQITDTLYIKSDSNFDSIFAQVEAEYNIDLCNEAMVFKGVLPISDKKQKITDLVVFDKCYPYIPGKDVDILLKNNKVRINMDYIISADSIRPKVLDYLINQLNANIPSHFLIQIEWKPNTESSLIEKTFNECINSIIEFADYQSVQLFNKKIEELNQEEFKIFKESFNIQMGLAPARPDFPNIVD